MLLAEKERRMTGFWGIIMFNWTAEERLELRGYVEAWMAADLSIPPR